MEVPLFFSIMISKFLQIGQLNLHCLEGPQHGPTLLLLHGLTANAHAFDGLIDAGLTRFCHLISVDLRGRGLSDAHESEYTMQAHAKDIIGLMDILHVQQVILGGHSFGALLSFYLAAHFPKRFSQLILMDAGLSMHPNTKEMLAPTLSRLEQTYPSFSFYLDKAQKAPYNTPWYPEMESYYRADVKEVGQGQVQPRSQLMHMIESVTGALSEPWKEYITKIEHPAILIHGPENYTLGAPLLPKENALETVALLKKGKYVQVPGNHQTMLYGPGAKAIVAAIQHFIENGSSN